MNLQFQSHGASSPDRDAASMGRSTALPLGASALNANNSAFRAMSTSSASPVSATSLFQSHANGPSKLDSVSDRPPPDPGFMFVRSPPLQQNSYDRKQSDATVASSLVSPSSPSSSSSSFSHDPLRSLPSASHPFAQQSL